MTVRVMVVGRLHRVADQAAFEAAIPAVSSTIKGTVGYLTDELLHDPADPASYILMSEWASREDFLNWEQSLLHKQSTSPLRAFWRAESAFKIYEVCRTAGTNELHEQAPYNV